MDLSDNTLETEAMGQKRIALLLRGLNEGLFEKEHVMSMALLAAVAGESLFLLGPPGVAKSMIARRMKKAFRSGCSFEYLMSRFSTPDEIFGPVSVMALKDENRYVRMTEGYLPEADVVFLDEIWKAGPGIQNALLTVLNEKIYLNGKEEMHLPLKLVIAASNELPAEQENLEALWDRFLVRCLVGGIADKELFNRMVSSPVLPEPEVDGRLQLTSDEMKIWSEGVDAVEIPAFVFVFIHVFRTRLSAFNSQKEEKADRGIYVSDRRWKKVVRLWRTSAFLNGVSCVHPADLLLLSDCIWDMPEQRHEVAELIMDALKEMCGDSIGLPLLSERMSALKDGAMTVSPVRPSFKVVKTFFYQVRSMYASRTVLIYTNEYDTLEESEKVHFILTTDRRKTGAQILRRYDKSRYPDIFPKDLLEVVRTSDGLQVNGRNYELLRSEAEVPVDVRPVVSAVSEDVVSRVSAELKSAAERMEQWMNEEQEYAHAHLFIDGAMREMLFNAMRRVQADISSWQIDCQELVHASRHK